MNMQQIAPPAGDRSDRYQAKRDRILDAASQLINERGAGGMTFADVARMVGLNTTSVTYYFKRKELLAMACYHRSIDRFESFVAAAETQPDRETRVAAFIAANFADIFAIRQGTSTPYAILSEVRTLDDTAKAKVLSRYKLMFGRLRALLSSSAKAEDRPRQTAQTHVLLELLYWVPIWIDRYDTPDLERVRLRMTDIVLNGIAAQNQPWSYAPLSIGLAEESGSAQENFLKAATELVNQLGYRGASVEKIASQLKVTKGSFYHHLDAKDDLVLACFRRSYEFVARSQHAAAMVDGPSWVHICSSIATLLEAQLGEDSPLLRSTALQALPPTVRALAVDDFNRLARRYAGMMLDGIADGSVRPVDTLIASQLIIAALNSAYDMRWWARRIKLDDAVEIYGSTLAFGLFGRS